MSKISLLPLSLCLSAAALGGPTSAAAQPAAATSSTASVSATASSTAAAVTRPAPGIQYEILGLDDQELIESLGDEPLGQSDSQEDVSKGEDPPAKRNEVTVFGRRVDPTRVAGAATEIKAEELAKFEYDDVQRILPKVGGVYVRDEDGQGLRPNIGLRGASSDRSAKISLLEDGVLFGPAPYSAPAAYYFPLTTRMDGIDIYKGPASILYGPFTVGGAINFKTAEVPIGTKASIDLALGRFAYGKAHGRFGWGNERFGFLIEGVRLQSDGFKELDGGGDTGFDKNEWMLKSHWNTDPEAELFHKVSVKVGWANENSRETYTGLTQEDFEQTPYRRYAATARDVMDWDRYQVELGYDMAYKDDISLSLRGYHHGFSRVWDRLNSFADGTTLRDVVVLQRDLRNADRLALLRGDLNSNELVDQSGLGIGNLIVAGNGRDFVSQGLQLDGEWNSDFIAGDLLPFLGQTLRFGLRLHRDSITRRHTATTYQMLQGTLVPTLDPVGVTTDNTGEALALSGYMQEEFHILPRFFLTLGARMESVGTNFEVRGDAPRSTSARRTTFLPGAGVLWRVLAEGDQPVLSLFAGLHRGFSPVAPGQPDEIKPESSWSWELGGRYKRGGASAELVGFFSDYRNLLVQCTFSTSCPEERIDRQFNAGSVFVYGLESQLGMQFDLGPILMDASASYTLTMSRFRSSFDSGSPLLGTVEEGDQLPYLPRHQANLSMGASWSRLSLFVSYLFVDRLRDQPGQGALVEGTLDGTLATDAQHVVDVTARWQITPANRLYLRFDNALNRAQLTSRRPFGARPSKPFAWQVGFQHEFAGI